MEVQVMEELMVFIGAMATLGCLTKVALVLLSRRREPETSLGARVDEALARLTHIEHTVDATAIEVERVAEGQRFTTRLLAERALPGAVPIEAPRVPGKSTTPH